MTGLPNPHNRNIGRLLWATPTKVAAVYLRQPVRLRVRDGSPATASQAAHKKGCRFAVYAGKSAT